MINSQMLTMDQHFMAQLATSTQQENLPEFLEFSAQFEVDWMWHGFNWDCWGLPEGWECAEVLLDLKLDCEAETVRIFAEAWNTKRIRESFMGLLHDPQRAGTYHIDESVYARLSICCLNYIDSYASK